MKMLNIAEKPSVAKSISQILDRNCATQRGRHKYCPNIYLNHEYEMIFTSVLGHLYVQDFVAKTKWHESDPYDLFEAAIMKSIPADTQPVVDNIRMLARTCDVIAIWTDCDREGENIAMQIKSLLPGKVVRRARFTGVSLAEVEGALNNLQDINERESNAVEARMELDLRIGSAFTRLQTLASRETSLELENVLSFGPCQIPTLNFVVQRHKRIVRFSPESFYSLQNGICLPHRKIILFKWDRGSIFDRNCVILFHQLLSKGRAVISEKRIQDKIKHRPLPLRTVEFQKVCGAYYRIPGNKLMDMAEKLYNNGYISYPRTETDSFSGNFDCNKIRKILKSDGVLGHYAERITPSRPRQGRNNDQAHAPIYPLKPGSSLIGDERKVYEFIARHFLACISEDAKGVETEYVMEISMPEHSGTEKFISKGMKITSKGYLEIYIYDKWAENETGEFVVGQEIPNNLEITTGKTTPPDYLSEAELIALMDKNGIGTDATIHEHILKIQVRGYAKMERYKICPTDLGINLIDAYEELNLNINEPTLRKNLENGLKKICEGIREKDELVKEEIDIYKRVYLEFKAGIDKFKEIICRKGNAPSRPKGRNPPNKTSAASTLLTRGPQKENTRPESRARTGGGAHVPKCDCGYDTIRKVAKTEANEGRVFYCCNKNYKRCNFFKWEDGM